MTTPSKLASLIVKCSVPGSVAEHADLLVFTADLGDPVLRSKLLELRRAPSFVGPVVIREADSDGMLDDGETPQPGALYEVSIGKPLKDGVVSLFFGAALESIDLTSVNSVLIADMDAGDTTFTTYRSRYQAWTVDPVPDFAPSETLPDPRRTSNDLTKDKVVPADIRCWLIQAKPVVSSAAYRCWAKLAARHLLAALANQVHIGDTGTVYQFSGPPTRKVQISDDEVVGLHDRLNEGATWVFADGARDADTRHLLLATEWARSHVIGGPAGLGLGSLDSAQAAYSAYVKSGSKETLKAIAELRKTVTDEAQKATQKAQDMTSALWKDLAVATTPFVIKVLPDAGKTPNLWIAGFFAVGAAVFLLFSIQVQLYLNRRYLASQAKARLVWSTRLNLVLSQDEVREISNDPIEGSVTDYHRVKTAVVLVYVLLIGILILFAAKEFREAVVAPDATAKSDGLAPTPVRLAPGKVPTFLRSVESVVFDRDPSTRSNGQ
jgi:hypothetical protein